MRNPWRALAPQSTPLTGTGVRAYGLAVLATAGAVALTRFTWPLFAGTPFAPLFGAVAMTSHFGTGAAGLLAVALAGAGSTLAFPSGGPSPWDPRTLALFIPVALVSSRIIAGRNRTAAALRASEAELRATWEHASLGAALLNPAGQVERINPALERLLGCSAAAAAGRPFSAFSHPDDEAAERQRFGDLVAGTGAFYQVEQRYLRGDATPGILFWGRVTVSVIRGPDGAPAGALAVLEDVTAQRQAQDGLRASEERLRRAQKMEAVGQLVAGVAHNFNNLMTVTMGYTEILEDRHGDHELDQSAIREIRKATERGAALTRQLLAFGRKHDARLARVDLNRAVAGLREMLAPVIREDIQLTIDVDSAPVAVVIDPYDLEQVIFNLVMNARDALPAGGSIHIEVARESVDAAAGAVTPGEYVRLRVRDNGIGMTPDVESHLFEPFFTTKEVGEGTGLGLAFVHGIARHGGGFVTVQTAPAKGTTVSVYLPPAPAPVVDAPPEPLVSAKGPASQGATILLVEDEDAVLKITAQVLSRAGHRVLSATTPAQACALFKEHAPDIDLLLTDIVMPEMHGSVLAERLLAQRPDLRVLFVSGYSDVMPAGTTATNRVAFLAKPFPASRLVTTVAELLTASTI